MCAIFCIVQAIFKISFVSATIMAARMHLGMVWYGLVWRGVVWSRDTECMALPSIKLIKFLVRSIFKWSHLTLFCYLLLLFALFFSFDVSDTVVLLCADQTKKRWTSNPPTFLKISLENRVEIIFYFHIKTHGHIETHVNKTTRWLRTMVHRSLNRHW